MAKKKKLTLKQELDQFGGKIIKCGEVKKENKDDRPEYEVYIKGIRNQMTLINEIMAVILKHVGKKYPIIGHYNVDNNLFDLRLKK